MTALQTAPHPSDSDGIKAIQGKIAELVQRLLHGKGEDVTAIAGLTIHGATAPAEPGSYVYEPSFAFIARGSKRVVLGGETYVYDEGHFLLTAVGLPTIVQVIDASEATPYFSIKLNVDLDLAAGLITDVDQLGVRQVTGSPAMALGAVTLPLAEATWRLVQLLDTPTDIPILARPAMRELLYRVLMGPTGGRLRQAVQVGSETSRIASVIELIRREFARPLRIDELATVAGMSSSTLHQRFRAVTAMSPLQYQKNLRLHEARRLMLNERIDASSAAYRVGYESATQFTREYGRVFGNPPKRDVTSILDPQRATPAAPARRPDD